MQTSFCLAQAQSVQVCCYWGLEAQRPHLSQILGHALKKDMYTDPKGVRIPNMKGPYDLWSFGPHLADVKATER